MSEWQPIETCPMDGTVVDIWVQSTELVSRDSDERRPSMEWRVANAQWWDGQWCDENGNPHAYLEGFTHYRATHWMPLPDGPT